MPIRFRIALFSGLALSASPLVALACCPGDGNGATKPASTGLGQSQAIAPGLSADPAWSVYEFERDGVRYVQVDDLAGNVRAAIGYIGDTFFVMPIGSDADRVRVPGGSTALPAYTSAKKIYGTDTFEVWVYQTASGDWWAIRRTGTR